MCCKRGGCAGFQQPKIIPPPLAETAEKIREVTYRFSWVSFVATLPRLALLSLHTTDPVTTAAGWCLAPAGATREPPHATQPQRGLGTEWVHHTQLWCPSSTPASRGDSLQKARPLGAAGHCLPLPSSLTPLRHYGPRERRPSSLPAAGAPADVCCHLNTSLQGTGAPETLCTLRNVSLYAVFTEQERSACLFTLTVNPGSPMGPGSPDGPGIPWSPRSPFSPVGPSRPYGSRKICSFLKN